MRLYRLLVVLLFASGFSSLGAECEGLVIVDAIWKWGVKEANVTSKVRERVHGDSLEFPVATDSLGDPAKGHHKILRVTYRYHGVEHTIECLEGRTLKLPQPTGDEPDTTLGGDQKAQIQGITDATRVVGIPKKGMEIVQAVFGIDGIWRDVTAIVQRSITDNRWKATLLFPYPELGGDPAKGKGKHLIVGYRLDGAPKVAFFDELKDKSIPVSLP